MRSALLRETMFAMGGAFAEPVPINFYHKFFGTGFTVLRADYVIIMASGVRPPVQVPLGMAPWLAAS